MPSSRFDSEHDERYTHRLEAFSDIVIGFSLAQLGVNFVIPPRAIDVYLHPTAAFAFVVTFSVIAIFWWSHHRLFEYYFVPRTSTVLLNFVILGLLIWLVFQLQLFARFEGTASHVVASLGYIFTFMLVYALSALQTALCVRIRWPQLDPQLRRQGVNAVGRVSSIVAGTLVFLAISLPLGYPEWGLFGTLAGQLAWRFLSPHVLARFAQPAALS
jgi:uncharacterized membrane protein